MSCDQDTARRPNVTPVGADVADITAAESDPARFHELRCTKSPNTKQRGRWEVRYDPNKMMQIWVRDESVTYDDRGCQIVRDNGWIECRWVLANHASILFGIDVLHAIRRDLGGQTNDRRVLEHSQQIHRQLLAGPRDSKLWPLTRREAAAAQANLARPQLCISPPGERTCAPPPSAPDPETAAEPAPVNKVEPMRPLRLSEGW
jgi:putative transposase